MTDRKKLLLPLIILGAGVLLAAVVIRARPDVERVETRVPAPLVRVEQVSPETRRLTVRSQGTVRPRTESVLVAQVAGRIERVSPAFADGGTLDRGAPLVTIEPRDYQLAVAQREAQVAQAEVLLERERAEAELARQEWEELGRGEPTALTLREPQLAEARAAVQAAEAALQRARLDLERTTVRAPFSGRIREKRVDVGQYVTPGTPLASVYATDEAEIKLPLPKDDLAFLDLDLGRPIDSSKRPAVTLVAELGGEVRQWDAVLVRADSEFDPQTRMLNLFASVERPLEADPALPMGLFVDAHIEGRELGSVVELPRSALRGESQVLVVDDDSRLRFRDVEILRLEPELAIIGAGLSSGDRVCVSPLETVTDGMLVRTESEAAS